MSRISGRRGLLVALLVTVLLAGIVDLLRPGSVIRGTWGRMRSPPETPPERAIERFLRTREVPLPRSNRVEAERTRGVIPPTGARTAA